MSGFVRRLSFPWFVAAVLVWGALWPAAGWTATKKKPAKQAPADPAPVPKAEPVPEPEAPPAHGPNVLLILVDDLNDWVGWLGGNPQTRTPNLDRLAHLGMRFTHAQSASAFSNPSRTALFTGMLPWNTGVWDDDQDWRRSVPIMGKATLPEFLLKNGYLTAASGKVFHAGGGGLEGRLTGGGGRRGFEQDAAWKERFPEGGAQLPEGPAHAGRNLNGLNSGAWDWGVLDLPEDETDDAKVVEWAKTFLLKPHDRSFFLTVGLNHPGSAWYAPQKYLDAFPLAELRLPEAQADDLKQVPETAKGYPKGEPSPKTPLEPAAVRAYLANIAFADAMVGRLLDALASSPEKDNTIVCLTSDHGLYLGQKQRWGQGGLWEEGSHVPLSIVAPGVTKPDTVCEDAVSLVDLYPTLVDLMEFPKPPYLDGESLVPLLKDPTVKPDRPAIIALGPGDAPGYAVRSNRWRYIRYADGSDELYDHASDPHERSNITGSPAATEVKADLAKSIPATVKSAHRAADQIATEKGADGSVSYLFIAGDHLSAKDSPDIAHRAFELEVEFDYHPAVDANATLLSQGSPQLGWALHLLEGRPSFTIQYEGLRATLSVAEPLAAGHVIVRALLGLDGTLGLSATGLKEGARGYAPMEGGFPSQPAQGLTVGEGGGPLDAQAFPRGTSLDGSLSKVVFHLLPSVLR